STQVFAYALRIVFTAERGNWTNEPGGGPVPVIFGERKVTAQSPKQHRHKILLFEDRPGNALIALQDAHEELLVRQSENWTPRVRKAWAPLCRHEELGGRAPEPRQLMGEIESDESAHAVSEQSVGYAQPGQRLLRQGCDQRRHVRCCRFIGTRLAPGKAGHAHFDIGRQIVWPRMKNRGPTSRIGKAEQALP